MIVTANLPFASGVACVLIGVHLLIAGAGPRGWPNRFLGGFFLLFACHLFIFSHQLGGTAGYLGPYRVAIILAANPLVYFFFRSLRVGGSTGFRLSDAVHFVPVLLILVVLAAGNNDGLDVVLFLSMAGYGIAYSLALRNGSAQFPTASKKAFRWLIAFATFYVFSAVLDAVIALELLRVANLKRSALLPVAVLVLFAASFVLMFGAMGRRPLFDWLQEIAANTNPRPIPDDVLDDIAARIRRVASEKRVYADEEMSLTRFARRVGAPSRHVSRAINTRLEMSFSDLLNNVRIEAAKSLLRDANQDGHSVAEIAYEVGFRSLSNFHRVFKNLTGTTPTRFRDETRPRNDS